MSIRACEVQFISSYIDLLLLNLLFLFNPALLNVVCFKHNYYRLNFANILNFRQIKYLNYLFNLVIDKIPYELCITFRYNRSSLVKLFGLNVTFIR